MSSINPTSAAASLAASALGAAKKADGKDSNTARGAAAAQHGQITQREATERGLDVGDASSSSDRDGDGRRLDEDDLHHDAPPPAPDGAPESPSRRPDPFGISGQQLDLEA